MYPHRTVLWLAAPIALICSGGLFSACDLGSNVVIRDTDAGDSALDDADRGDAGPADTGQSDTGPEDSGSDGALDSDQDAAEDVGPQDTAGDLDAEPDIGTDTDVDPDVSADVDPDVIDTGSGGVVRYLPGALHSPITASVSEGLRAVLDAGSRDRDNFVKIGDSITVSNAFLDCFAGSAIDLDGRAELQATIDHFNGGDIGGASPFERDSTAAVVGWSAFSALSGDPNPIERELTASNAAFASVMYGSNDVQLRDIFGYADDMADIIELLLSGGTVPILSTAPPRDDNAEADAFLQFYNLYVRALAELHQVPLVDYNRAMLPLPGHGLAGDDLHPNVYWPEAGVRACVLTDEGLDYGYNTRNLLTLQALHRALGAANGVEAPDASGASYSGTGDSSDPWIVDQLPFTHAATTSGGPTEVDAYPACDGGQNEAGPERTYRLDLDVATSIRLMAFDRGDVDVDVHVLSGSPSPADCVDRDHQDIAIELGAGTHYIVVDSWVDAAGTVHDGDYILTIGLP